MSMNLIKNYIDLNKSNPADYALAQQKAKDRANFLLLAETNNLKPLSSDGRLVRSSLLTVPSDFVSDVSYDFKALKNSLKGDSNDHQLGRMNDLGMKAGGLAIASYLFTKKVAPTSKYMEFIGLGSFFASMALWPKIALQAPAKLIHGFDIRQKYEDSMGRKKFVFSDPQYIPWDLYGDDEINKIGDKLRVPKDLPNRREYIQEKMKKIAVQNNTMWMLTAGFATPIMSALICNLSEKHVGKVLDKSNNHTADKLIENIDKSAEKYTNKALQQSFDNLLTENKGKPVDAQLAEKIVKAFHSIPDTTVIDGLSADITKVLQVESSGVMVDEKTIQDALQKCPELIANNYELTDIEAVKKSLPSVKEVADEMKAEKLFGRELLYNDVSQAEFSFLRAVSKKLAATKLIDLSNGMGGLRMVNIDTEEVFMPSRVNILTDEKISQLKSIFSVLETHSKKFAVMSEYFIRKFGDKSETSLVNAWNSATGDIVDILGLNNEKTALACKKPGLVGDILGARFEQIASDDNEYKKVLTELVKRVQGVEQKIGEELQGKYVNAFGKLIQDASVDFVKQGLTNTSGSLIGLNEKRHLLADYLKQLQEPYYDMDDFEKEELDKIKKDVLKKFKEWGASEKEMRSALDIITNADEKTDKKILQEAIHLVQKVDVSPVEYFERFKKVVLEQRISDVQNVFYRMIDTLDLFRRIAKNELGPSLPKELPIEIKKDLIELAKKVMVQGHMVEYSQKLPHERFAVPDMTSGDIQVDGGVIKNAASSTHIDAKPVEITYHSDFFKRGMRLLYANKTGDETIYSHQMDALTEQLLKEAGIYAKVESYNKKCFFNLGNMGNPLNGNKVFDAGNINGRISYYERLIKLIELVPFDASCHNYTQKLIDKVKELKERLKAELAVVDTQEVAQKIREDAKKKYNNISEASLFKKVEQIKSEMKDKIKNQEFAQVAETLFERLEKTAEEKTIAGFKTLEDVTLFIKKKQEAIANYKSMLQDFGSIVTKEATPRECFGLVSCAPEDFVRKLAQDKFSTQKWLKIFGGFGAGLLAVTVASQFFFGKMKQPDTRKVNIG